VQVKHGLTEKETSLEYRHQKLGFKNSQRLWQMG